MLFPSAFHWLLKRVECVTRVSLSTASWFADTRSRPLPSPWTKINKLQGLTAFVYTYATSVTLTLSLFCHCLFILNLNLYWRFVFSCSVNVYLETGSAMTFWRGASVFFYDNQSDGSIYDWLCRLFSCGRLYPLPIKGIYFVLFLMVRETKRVLKNTLTTRQYCNM